MSCAIFDILLVFQIKMEKRSRFFCVIGLEYILDSHEAKSRAPNKFRDQVNYTKYYNEMEFLRLKRYVVATTF